MNARVTFSLLKYTSFYRVFYGKCIPSQNIISTTYSFILHLTFFSKIPDVSVSLNDMEKSHGNNLFECLDPILPIGVSDCNFQRNISSRSLDYVNNLW